MTTREKRLSILLGGFIAVAVVGGGGYAGVYLPLSDSARTARNLEGEIAEKTAKLAAIQKDRKRLDVALKRSLPADQDLARGEYEAAIGRLLREAKVSPAVYSIKPKPVDNRSAPELDPKTKKPAYLKVSVEVSLKPVDLATLIDVLHRYYRLDLLQQITRFTVKKIDTGSASTTGRRRFGAGLGGGSSVLSDKPDLDVTFVTEAIILDGAENRRTLLPLPPGIGAVAGGVPNALPEPARGVTPLQLVPVLATAGRDYTLLLSKDVFHGPLPARVEVVEKEVKEDTSPFIRLTAVGRNPDGSGSATIEDVASKQEYAIELKRKGGHLLAEVIKYYFLKGVKKAWGEPDAVLDISDATSSTARRFRVVGLDGDGMGLVLAEADGKGHDAHKGAPRKGPSKPHTPPAAAVVGGVAAAAPQERIFVWHPGEPLSKLTELHADEATKAIQRATADATPPAAVPTRPPTVPVATPPVPGKTALGVPPPDSQ